MLEKVNFPVSIHLRKPSICAKMPAKTAISWSAFQAHQVYTDFKVVVIP